MRYTFSFLLLLTLFLSCETRVELVGLWLVESVEVEGERMTPNARWMQFNADHSQVSGNGRLQHSYGHWTFNASSKALTVVNENGLLDRSGPFNVSLSGSNTMSWTRMEEGQQVQVNLVRIANLPEANRDKLLGLWRLEAVDGDGPYFNASDEEKGDAYAFFRWDGRFVFQGKDNRINGVYNVHGHRSEVECIPYGEQLNRDFWNFSVDSNQLALTRLNSEAQIEYLFQRIHQFPE